MSREEDFKKVEEGLKILQLNFRRVADKFQHLNQSVAYFGDEIVMLGNNMQAVTNLFMKAQPQDEKVDKTKHKKEVKKD